MIDAYQIPKATKQKTQGNDKLEKLGLNDNANEALSVWKTQIVIEWSSCEERKNEIHK